MEINCKIKKTYCILFLLFFNCLVYSGENVVKVISYNIHGLPPIFTKGNDKERIKFIFENTYKKYDLILFQENWVYQNLLYSYFKNNFIISDKTNFKRKNNPKRSSGLNIIYNNIILEEHSQHLFKVCNGWLDNGSDCFASKGFIQAVFNIDGYAVNLFLTHLDAGSSENDIFSRKKQLLNLESELMRVDNGGPVIVCGDFNIDYYSDNSLILDFLVRNNLNIIKWDEKEAASEMIDYVFFKNGIDANINLLDYGIDKTLLPYSDHPPIYFNFTID